MANPSEMELHEIQSSPPRDKSSLGRVQQTVLVTCLMLGFLFSTVDTCIVSIPLITISKEFDNFVHAPWVILSYLLTYMAFATSLAQLSDIYGRRNLLLFSWLIFVAFSYGCGVARDMTTLIVCRAFQGLGGSGLYSLAQVSIVEIGPGHKPSLVGAMMGGTLALAFICGPLLGGWITQESTWRWIFNMNVPFGLVVMVALAYCWPREPHSFSILTSWSAFASIDFVGGTTLLFASGLLVYAVQQGGSQASAWSDVEIVSALSLALLCWVVFFSWETLLAFDRFPHIRPIFPVRLASNRVYIAALTTTFLTGFSFVPLTIIIPERFQMVHGDQPLTAGVNLLPMLGACAVGSFLSGVICSKRNSTSYILMAAACLQLVGLGLMSTLEDPDADVRSSYGFQSVFGLGTGLVFSAATIIAAVQSVMDNDLAIANGAMAQVRVLSGCVGISVCTVVFNANFNAVISQLLSSQQLVELHRSPTAAVRWPDNIREAVRNVYATAYSDELRIMLYVAALMPFAAIFTFERHPTPVHKAAAVAKEQFETDHGDSDVEMSSLREVHAV